MAACEDRTVRIWNLNGASGEALCLCTAALPPGAVPIMAATAAQQDGFEEGGRAGGGEGGGEAGLRTGPADTRCAVGSSNGSVHFYDLSGEQCPLVQVLSTVLAVREASGAEPNPQDATNRRSDIRAAAFVHGQDLGTSAQQDPGEGLCPGIILASPDSLIVLDGETYEILNITPLIPQLTVDHPANSVALDIDYSGGTRHALCYVSSPFSGTISVVRVDLDAL